MLDNQGYDQLVPDPQVRREFAANEMRFWRWDRDPAMAELGWPPPIKIGRRKFRSRRQLEAFKANLVAEALSLRGARSA